LYPQYPTAFRTYNAHCLTPSKDSKVPLSKYQQSLVGTTLLIPPVPKTPHQHWIACLFTSYAYGRNVSPPKVIVENTKAALEDLTAQVEALKQGERKRKAGGDGTIQEQGIVEKEEEHTDGPGEDSEAPGECWAVRINSGMFGVPWRETKSVLEAGGLNMTIVRPEGEDEGDEEEDAEGVGGNALSRKGKRKSEEVNKDESDGGGAKAASKRRKAPETKGKDRKNGLDRWLI